MIKKKKKKKVIKIIYPCEHLINQTESVYMLSSYLIPLAIPSYKVLISHFFPSLSGETRFFTNSNILFASPHPALRASMLGTFRPSEGTKKSAKIRSIKKWLININLLLPLEAAIFFFFFLSMNELKVI